MRFEFVAIDPLTCQVIWQVPSSRHHISFHPLLIHVTRKFPLEFFSNAKRENISEKCRHVVRLVSKLKSILSQKLEYNLSFCSEPKTSTI